MFILLRGAPITAVAAARMNMCDKDYDEEARVCSMNKGNSGFGFILCCETDSTDTYVLHVLKSSPASEAGLRIGDRIILVNGDNVEKDSHQKVVEKLHGLKEVELSVVYNSLVNKYFNRPESRISVKPLDDRDDLLRPRLVQLVKSPTGYDFSLVSKGKNRKRPKESGVRPPLRGVSGHYVGEVKKGGVSERAGLHNGDRIVELNNVNVEKESHRYIIATMKSCSRASLLVVDEKTDEFFTHHSLSPSVKHLTGKLDLGAAHDDEVFQSLPTSPMYAKNAKAVRDRNVISHTNLLRKRDVISTDLCEMNDAMRDLTVSTPNLTQLGRKQGGIYESGESFDSLESSSSPRYQTGNRRKRVAKAKREIKKQLSSRFGWRLSFARQQRPSQEFKMEARKLYDEISLSAGNDGDESTTASSSASATPKLGEFNSMSSESRISFKSNSSLSPESSPRTSSSNCSSVSNDKQHKRLFSRTVYPETCVVETPPPAYRSTEDLSSIGYQVDLKTLKEHVQKNLTNNRKGALKTKPNLADLYLAHQVVNSY